MKSDLDVLISLHDVMPDTFPRMKEILRYLKEHGIPPITLLIVPGLEWSPPQIRSLHQLASEGYELAAHGWKHKAIRISRPYHRLHAACFSRNVAEHLALDSGDILELMIKSAKWFPDHDFPQPSLYVPPAWALGPLSGVDMKQLPYSKIEVLRGFIDPATGQLDKVPMVGFEADTSWRKFWLRRWNSYQLRKAKNRNQPLRIAIHPNDFRLRMAGDLRKLIGR